MKIQKINGAESTDDTLVFELDEPISEAAQVILNHNFGGINNQGSYHFSSEGNRVRVKTFRGGFPDRLNEIVDNHLANAEETAKGLQESATSENVTVRQKIEFLAKRYKLEVTWDKEA